MTNKAPNAGYFLSEADYQNLIKAYHLIGCLSDLTKKIHDTATIDVISLSGSLMIAEGFAESIFSVEPIKAEQ